VSGARDPSIVAADPKRSAWVAANAGSGKTYTLANRVTRLLLDGARPDKILCLTYTKAAAAEMQGRLFDQLGELAMLPDTALEAKLVEIGSEGGSDLRVARRLFAQALETPGGLKIQTIHSFCQTVLGRFPLEANVPPGFRILDEQSSRELMAAARSAVLERAGSGDTRLFAALGHLVTKMSERRLNDILDTALGSDRRALERFLSSLDRTGDALSDMFRRAHGLESGEAEESIIASFCTEERRESARLREAAEWLAGGAKSDKEKGNRLRDALDEELPVHVFAGLRSALLKADGGRFDKFVTAGLARTNPLQLSFLEARIDRMFEAEQRRRAAYAAELCQAIVVIAGAVKDRYAAEKRVRGVLDYDDLIARTRELLSDREVAQWVLYRLDNGLDHILVDEAQDTSPDQWAIVTKLTEEFFAGEGARPGALVRTVFAVGDEKQSIFSFQGAKPEQFDLHRRYFLERAVAAAHDFSDEPLTISRRSAPEILSFVDAVFAPDAARAGLTTSEDPIVHIPHRKTAQGRVEFWPALKPPETPEPDPMREVDLPSQASPVVKLAERIAALIDEWIRNKVRLHDREKPIRPGDIMILLPRREPFGPEIIRRLKDRGIPVAGADRMHLIDQIATMDLLALGHFVLLPEDNLALAEILRSPFCRVSEEGLFNLCYGREGRLWPELARRRGEDPAYQEAYEFLSGMLAQADFAPPYEFYSHALTTLGMRKRLLERLGAEARDSIDEFLSLAFAFEASNVPSLEGFLRWIEQGGAEVKRDMERGRNEVRVMTVHAAKGLEADIVFLPDTTTVPQEPSVKGHLLYDGNNVVFPVARDISTESIQAAKARAGADVMREHRRLLYVALTRAKDWLFVCGFENKLGVRPGSWYRMCEKAAKTMGTETLRDGEPIWVVGESGYQYSLAIEPAETEVNVPNWARTPPQPDPPLPRLLRPSDAIDPEKLTLPNLANRAQRFRRGQLVHALLATLPDVKPSERATVARRFLYARGLEEDEADEMIAETLAVIGDPAFAPAFAAGSRAEVAITADLPEIGPGARVNGRVDRLAVLDDLILIVDFKTNRPPPAAEEDVAPLYVAQMALYRAAAARILPARRIACALLWTEAPRLMALSEQLMEQQIAHIRSRLDPPGVRS
jgi:ATP-dependent helicase/nuclease subunit A